MTTPRFDDVVICSTPGCGEVARYHTWCIEHAPPPPPRPKRAWAPRVSSAPDLTDAEYAELRARVAADAAPLFLLAMQFILGQQVRALAEEAAALEAGR